MIDALQTRAPSTPWASLPGGAWRLWRSVVLRSTGFPAAAVLRLASSAAAEGADRLLDLQQRQEELRLAAAAAVHQALDTLRQSQAWEDKSRRRPLLDALHALGTGKPPRRVPDEGGVPAAVAAFAAARDACAAELLRFRESFDEGWHRIAQEIQRVAGWDRFREAVCWQNAGAVSTGLDVLLRQPPSGARNSQRRQKEELVANYLQRYCVKNDSIGFFGPVGFARFAESGPPVSVLHGPGLVARRAVYFENWCIDELARTLSADPELRPWLAPRFRSSFHLEGGLLHRPFGAPVPLPPVQVRLLAAADGSRTAREIAAELIGDPSCPVSSEEEVYALLGQLVKARLLSWSLEVPLELHPERTLAAQLQRIEPPELRAEALEQLEMLDGARREVAQAAGSAEALAAAMQRLEETFTRLTGKPPRHHHGETYAARGLVYEDCRRDLDATLGPGLLNRLGPPLELYLQGARWLTGRLTEVVEARLATTLADLAVPAGGDPVPSHTFFVQVLSSLFLKRDRDPLFLAVAREFQERWARVLLLPACGERRVRRSCAVLAPRVAEQFGTAGRCWSLARHLSPDLMIAAAGREALERGELELTLGEVHSGNTLLWSCFLSQHPDPESVLATAQLDAEGAVIVLPQMLKQSWTQRMNPVVPPGFYRFCFADDPPSRNDLVLAAGELVVEEADGRPRCRTRDGRLSFDAIDLFSQYLFLECNSIMGSLVPPQPHTPRISFDDLVIARERWRVQPAELAFAFIDDSAERYLAARRWARAAGLPRFCFFKVGSEKKPCYLDFDSPIYLDIFSRLVRIAAEAAAGEAVSVAEMFPSLDHLWLEDAAGDRYTCELRMTAIDAQGQGSGASLTPAG